MEGWKYKYNLIYYTKILYTYLLIHGNFQIDDLIKFYLYNYIITTIILYPCKWIAKHKIINLLN